MNPWLVFSLILLGIWLVIFIFKRGLRKEMILVSLLTMPFGLTEPLFVPKYWNPPSLFDLAANIGFDIESLIFSFAIGGIGAVLYELIFGARHQKIDNKEMHRKKHKFHLFALISAPIVFIFLFFLTNLNPIYSTSIAMFIGGISALYCRPDLKKKIWVGGFLFFGLYFLFFLSFNLVYPDFIEKVWNLAAISGILVIGVPIEELIFAFTFGMLWSSYYEHIGWYGLKRERFK